MMTEKMITLNNGVEIPQLALGTWIVDDNKVAEPEDSDPFRIPSCRHGTGICK